MKKNVLVLLFIAFLNATAITSCTSIEKKEKPPTGITKEQYQCPMKCTEEIFEKPDTCKICGMDLVKISKG
ncbi:MAG: hypothetical protein NTX97_03275 [Bacteroidetes bacterium]|nr:hypothetical protein [Bacteroidota bacterium]